MEEVLVVPIAEGSNPFDNDLDHPVVVVEGVGLSDLDWDAGLPSGMTDGGLQHCLGFLFFDGRHLSL
jgi:hypothetical protein